MSYRRGMGAVGPGIDISHYGAPYAQMLGLGNSGDGLGMLYRYGAGLGWTPGPGQTPADDPRILSQFGKFRQTYKTSGPSGWGTTSNKRAVGDALLRAARMQFPGQTVRKAGSTGWVAGGRIGFEVTLAQPMRWGEIKGNGKIIERANPLGAVVDGLRLTLPLTQKLQGTLETPEAAADPSIPPADPGAEAPEESGGGGLLSAKIGGLPVWAVGIMGIGIVGGVAFLALRKKKKPAPVAANRRRRRRRRRSSKRRRRSSRR